MLLVIVLQCAGASSLPASRFPPASFIPSSASGPAVVLAAASSLILVVDVAGWSLSAFTTSPALWSFTALVVLQRWLESWSSVHVSANTLKMAPAGPLPGITVLRFCRDSSVIDNAEGDKLAPVLAAMKATPLRASSCVALRINQVTCITTSASPWLVPRPCRTSSVVQASLALGSASTSWVPFRLLPISVLRRLLRCARSK